MWRKLSYIVLYFLGGLLGLTSGLLFTIILGTAKGQGLASGGIVVFNALVGLGLGIALAIIATVKVENKQIPKTNIIMLLINIVFIALLILIVVLKT